MSGARDAAIGAGVRDLPVVFLVIDRAGQVHDCNSHTRMLLGRPVVGEPIRGLMAQFAPAIVWAEVGTEPVEIELPFATFAGLPQTVACTVRRVDDEVVLIGGVDVRVAELLRRELVLANQELATRTRELQKANAELERLGRMKDLFLGMAAHDLRSPLQAIMLHVDLLRVTRADPAEKVGDLADGIDEAAGYMQRIVEAFLDVALIQAGQLRIARGRCVLAEVAAVAIRLVTAAARARAITIRMVEVELLPPLWLDGPKLQQVVVNLLANAINHSPTGGEVVLELGRIGDVTTVRIRDAGRGVAPEVQQNLFAAFTHDDARRQGAADRSIGLGLTICRKIAEAHGGAIVVESTDAGAVFALHLPVVAPSSAPGPSAD